MKARTSCWLAVCLLWTVWGAELTCPFAYLNESYFAMGKPPYLRTPKLQTQSTVCRATWGKQSCCDGPTLEAIKDRYAEFHRDIVAKASASMKMIKGVFEPVQKLNLIERIGSWSAIRLQVLIDKYLQPVKQQFYLLTPSSLSFEYRFWIVICSLWIIRCFPHFASMFVRDNIFFF